MVFLCIGWTTKEFFKHILFIQIARLLGAAKVVGICGSEEKCRVVQEEFGFDSAINYKTTDVAAELMKICPEGVHVYFDNVGGDLSTSVIKQVSVVGLISYIVISHLLRGLCSRDTCDR